MNPLEPKIIEVGEFLPLSIHLLSDESSPTEYNTKLKSINMTNQSYIRILLPFHKSISRLIG